jgi:hypothetical protein
MKVRWLETHERILEVLSVEDLIAILRAEDIGD